MMMKQDDDNYFQFASYFSGPFQSLLQRMNIKTSSQNHKSTSYLSSSSSLVPSSQPRFHDETNGLHYLNLDSPSNHHHQLPSIDHQHHYHPSQQNQQQQQLSKTWTNGANISNIQSTIYPPSSPKPSNNSSNNLSNTYSSSSISNSGNRNFRNTTNSGPSAIVRMKIKIPAAEESSRSSMKLSIPTVYNMNKIKIDSSEATGMYNGEMMELEESKMIEMEIWYCDEDDNSENNDDIDAAAAAVVSLMMFVFTTIVMMRMVRMRMTMIMIMMMVLIFSPCFTYMDFIIVFIISNS